ncbi:MAG: IS1595 family transposase [Pseudomonadota bacterium]
MSVLSKSYFHDEAEAFKFLERIIWGDEIVCPHCGACGERVYALEGVRTKPSKKHPKGKVRHGLKKCGECRKQFTVKVGTVFEHGRIPLHKMLQGVYLMTSSKKGISAHQLHRTLEITYKSAWFLAHRIREAMRDGQLDPFGGEGGKVQADETYIGRKQGVKKHPRAGGFGHKMTVVSLLDERTGKARSIHAKDMGKGIVAQIVKDNVHRESRLITDEARHYKAVGRLFADHESVFHGGREYVRGDITTNHIEGYFSIFKRGMRGVYQHCGEKHLHRYLAEFDFRYSNREANGVNDEARHIEAVKGIVGKRLTYRRAGEWAEA